MLIYDSGLKMFYSTKTNDKNFFAGFTTRELGDGRDRKNIERFFDFNGFSYKRIISLDQIHSANVAVLELFNGINEDVIEETDGVITKLSGEVLTVIAADCLPIVYVDKKEGIIGISHQGWRGSLKRLPQKMIDKMLEVGSKKNGIVVAVGPGIGDCCYDIDEERYFEFISEFEGFKDRVFSLKHGKRYLNLRLLVYLLLIEAGVKKENIDFFPFCTHCDKKRFFSARRIKKANFPRQFSFIMRY